jgi:AraC-like DNA-binding protein
LIEQSEEAIPLGRLAEAVGLSASYFHRLFKATAGLTPKDYAAAHRAARVREGLANGRSVTEAIYDAGFNSSGRFYEKSTEMLGMTPTRYRDGGTNEDIRFAVGQSSLGAILVASSAKGVVSILIGDDPNKLARDLQDRFPTARLIGGDPGYETLVAEVVGLVEAPGLGLDLPLDVRAALRSSSASGWPCARSRWERPSRMRMSPRRSVRQRRCGPSPAPAPPTRSPWRSRATASCGATARSRATPGESSAGSVFSNSKTPTGAPRTLPGDTPEQS